MFMKYGINRAKEWPIIEKKIIWPTWYLCTRKSAMNKASMADVEGEQNLDVESMASHYLMCQLSL